MKFRTTLLAAMTAIGSAAVTGETVDAAKFGFSPSATPAANVAALQKALDGGRKKVVVTEPGVYGMDATVFIDSETELEFARGAVLKKTAKYSNVLVNRGAYENRRDHDITVRGLEISVNGFQMIPPGSSPAKNLRGQLAFYRIDRVQVYDFRCVDLGNYQYCVHFVDFDGVLVDGVEIRGKKDGVHFNAGRNFTVRNGVFCTCDDALAANAGDWPDCAPMMGSLENGLFENIRYLQTPPEDAKKPGELGRIDASSWVDWHPGIKLQRNDTVRVGSCVYAVSPMPLETGTNEIVSLTAPSHRNGVWQSPEGINFLYLQDNGANRCDAKNIVFRNIVSEHQYGILVTWETGSKWCRAVHPEVKPEDYPYMDVTFENCEMKRTTPLVRGGGVGRFTFRNCRSAGALAQFGTPTGVHGVYPGTRREVICENCVFEGGEKADFTFGGAPGENRLILRNNTAKRPVILNGKNAANVQVEGETAFKRR